MRSIQIQDSISGEWRDAPDGTRVRFNFAGRWNESMQTDTWVDVSLAQDRDAVKVRGLSHLTISAEAGNTVEISADRMEGGATEIVLLRKRELELIHELDEARDTFGTRRKKAGLPA